MADITSINGGEYLPSTVVDEETRESCVNQAKKLLELAENGQITAFVAQIAYADATFNTEYAGRCASSGMLARIELAKITVANELIKDGF